MAGPRHLPGQCGGTLRRTLAGRRPRICLVAGAAALALAATASAVVAARVPAYSSASRTRVQRQPRAGSCHLRGSGLDALPDPRCTPGLRNPAVTPRTVGRTICARGWTARVRPPESVTEPEKRASMAAYGITGPPSRYEYDHLIPLELGGAVNAPGNLWPELDDTHHSGEFANPKDHLEDALNHLVCAGRMPLLRAQELIADDWVAAERTYG